MVWVCVVLTFSACEYEGGGLCFRKRPHVLLCRAMPACSDAFVSLKARTLGEYHCSHTMISTQPPRVFKHYGSSSWDAWYLL